MFGTVNAEVYFSDGFCLEFDLEVLTHVSTIAGETRIRREECSKCSKMNLLQLPCQSLMISSHYRL